MRGLLLIAGVLLAPELCRSAVIDFEGLSTGTLLSTEFQASDSLVFLENANVYFLGTGHATSGQLGLYYGGATIIAEFRLPSNAPAVTDLVSIKGDLIPTAGNVFLNAYDIDGNLIASDIQPDSPAPATLMVAAKGIHRIEFYSKSGTVAFDDLRFNTPVGEVGDTPEPASIALVLGGGLALFTFRRRG